jgi:predicted DNA-binding protein YlxM (UPF0122 family)
VNPGIQAERCQSKNTSTAVILTVPLVSPPRFHIHCHLSQLQTPLEGEFSPCLHQSKVDVLCLTTEDIEATLQEVEDFIKTTKARVKSMKEELQLREIGGARLQDLIKSSETQIAAYEQKLQVVSEMPNTLGKVMLSSGKLLTDHRILDWAFVEMATAAAGSFSANILPEIPKKKRPQMYGKGAAFPKSGLPLQ